MITVHLMGGLGNQLFQIFTCIAFSLNNKVPFKLPYYKDDKKSQHGYDRPTYWDNILNRLIIFTEKDNNKLNYKIYRELKFHYYPLNGSFDNFKLFGYYQSYRYFNNQRDNIFKLIGIQRLIDDTSNKYNNLLCHKDLISLHFRIGDYKYIESYHPVLGMSYYKNCIDLYINKLNTVILNILIFYEHGDKDKVNKYIKILVNKYPNINIIMCPTDIHDWECMLLMSSCSHNIIANSSFSWWGAYINNNKDKIICYPNKWFGPNSSDINTKDLCPSTWNKINDNI